MSHHWLPKQNHFLLWLKKNKTNTLTRTATILLVAAIHAVRVSITPPTDGDAVSVLTLELVDVTFQIAPMLKNHGPQTPRVSLYSSNFILNTYRFVFFEKHKKILKRSPHQIHQHSRGLRRTSTFRQYSARLCRRTHSQNIVGALRGNRDEVCQSQHNINTVTGESLPSAQNTGQGLKHPQNQSAAGDLRE